MPCENREGRVSGQPLPQQAQHRLHAGDPDGQPEVGVSSGRRARRGLVVGNYCHDVLFRDGKLVGKGLGGAIAFVANVMDTFTSEKDDAGSALHCHYVSRAGSDLQYPVPYPPVTSSSPTTVFHAYFSSVENGGGGYHADRVLRRVSACDPILPSDLDTCLSGDAGSAAPFVDAASTPVFDFGLAVGVGGEILPETLARMLDICRIVLVDVQALIRTFELETGGTVKLNQLRDTPFFRLLPRVTFLKASADEAPYVDIQEARKWCCVLVTHGEDGCRLYWKDWEAHLPAFPALQVDPTGAGDSFLGGFVAGLTQGLSVPDSALLGNFFGSLTVRQIGVPRFRPQLMQAVQEELKRKTSLTNGCLPSHLDGAHDLQKFKENKDFVVFLVEVSKFYERDEIERKEVSNQQ